MKRIFWLLVFIPFVFNSCEDEEDDVTTAQMTGEYEGYFDRDGVKSGVTLFISEKSFSGTSAQVKFPAICNGTYRLNGKTIEFVNECPWTAEFDWTLILSGKWSYRIEGNSLHLENSLGDFYMLEKK
ncbi:hypothetical protein MQE36_15480 [Zhouia spongiae]|uniref:Lipocalin-like domain-containing protein n=1 Tax=Zhouia spongiae TaxID=2202721 RepID=A0ABY3YL94_9FLAO|nr:hypothetical protein [Zhouia spongiae]UNY98468.1 hypothetical protein MQE36_15480 [Zhouia spongiae]